MTLALTALPMLAASGTIPEFFAAGFKHILPGGPDHILFILGLFFLSRSFGTLLFQMTLFTMAHSLTLGLSLYGVVSVPSRTVEIAIALSIAFVGIENVYRDHLTRWRPWVVFGFGLVHGLGFAHTFEEELLNPAEFLPALFSFNLGIEFGQLAVIGIAYVLVSACWNRGWYRKAVARPASILIVASGLYWAMERII